MIRNMEKLDGKELKLRYLNERKGNEKYAIQLAEQIDKLWAIPYLIGQYHALMTLTSKYPSNVAHLNSRMWVIEHALCIIAKYGSENTDRQSSSIIDSFLDATDGYISAAIHEQNTEYCEGSLLPHGKLRSEFIEDKDKDYPVYREYVKRLIEYNYRESIPLPIDDVLKIFKNEFVALDELVAKCAENTVEQIVEFVDRYVFAQNERFKKPSSYFQFKDFNWDISTFKWTENDLKEISPSGFNLHHFMESFTFNPNNFRVQEVIASYLRNAPFIKCGKTVWYISPEIFITSLSVMTREILENNKNKLYLQRQLDELKERQFLDLIINMLGSYGYRPLFSKKEYILDGEEYEIDLFLEGYNGRYLCVEAKATRPHLSLLFDYSYKEFKKELSNTNEDLRQLERLSKFISSKAGKEKLGLREKDSIRIISITKYPMVTSHVSNVFCCTLYELEELLKHKVDLCSDNLYLPSRPLNIPTKELPSELQAIIPEGRFQISQDEEGKDVQYADGWILWDREDQGFFAQRFNGKPVLIVFHEKREAIKFCQRHNDRYRIFPLHKKDFWWTKFLKKNQISLFIGITVGNNEFKGQTIEPENFFITTG